MIEVYELEPATREHRERQTLAARFDTGDPMKDYLAATGFAESLTKRYATTHKVTWNGREQARFVWKTGRGVQRLELRANPPRRFAVVEARGRTIVRRHGTFEDPRRAYRKLREAAGATYADVYLIDADTRRVIAVGETVFHPHGRRVGVRAPYRLA